MTIIYFIIALGVLVLVHEWGHYIVAKKSGIRVEQFSIGFGPKIFGFNYDGTEFKISPIPLGGYVKLYGEDPVGESEGNEAKAQEIATSKDAFSAASIRARLATVMAGPAMNIILCFLVMPLVFLLGRQVPAIMEASPVILGIKADSPASRIGLAKDDVILSLNGKPVATWTDVLHQIIINPNQEVDLTVSSQGAQKSFKLPLAVSPYSDQMMGYAGFEPQFFWGNDPIVGQVSANSPAHKAGLQSGDRITSIEATPVSSWDDLTFIVRKSEGKALNFGVDSKGELKTLVIQPEYNEGAKAYVVGITKFSPPDQMIKKQYGFVESVKMGFQEVGKLFDMTLDVLKRLLSFNLSYKALGGPLQIAQASGQAAQAGLPEFLYFLCFLSLQLGVLNLLPIPVLDGGHVLFMTIEGIIRRPLPMKLKNALTSAGMFLLLGLMVLITINDVDRLFSFERIKGMILSLF
jgi:regulator of sigma E protease